MDVMCADALKLTPLKYTPLTTGGEFVTDGSADSTANRNLEVQDLRRIHDRLHGDLKCPKFRNGKYVGILSTRAARGLKNDSEYKDWLAPQTSEPAVASTVPPDSIHPCAASTRAGCAENGTVPHCWVMPRAPSHATASSRSPSTSRSSPGAPARSANRSDVIGGTPGRCRRSRGCG